MIPCVLEEKYKHPLYPMEHLRDGFPWEIHVVLPEEESSTGLCKERQIV